MLRSAKDSRRKPFKQVLAILKKLFIEIIYNNFKIIFFDFFNKSFFIKNQSFFNGITICLSIEEFFIFIKKLFINQSTNKM